MGVQRYAIVLLRESGFLRTGQAEPPATPERRRESNSILEQAREVSALRGLYECVGSGGSVPSGGGFVLWCAMAGERVVQRGV